MHMHYLTVLALCAASAVVGKPVSHPRDLSARESSEKTLNSLAEDAYDEAMKAFKANGKTQKRGSCTLSTLKVRREWSTLSTKDKKAYIKAVQCLQSKPALTPASKAPGAKTRFDDFVATHIDQTLTIHYTGNFLSWHRYYTWLYEEALRNECGYTGTQPYWDWAKTAKNGFKNDPVWDGSDTSMSGDGAHIDQTGDIVLGGGGLPPVYLPTGTGGGCVKSGPFKDMKVNLGPASLVIPGNVTIASDNPLAYNPRCLKRDLTDYVIQSFSNATAVVNNIIQPSNVYDFQMQMQGIPGTGNIGVHGGGHYAMGGDPGRDVYTSPGDPAFYLHHAMIDRTWWIWQMLDPASRQFSDDAVMGTNTFLDSPPSAETTLDDYVEYGYAAGPPRKIRTLLSTLAGPFCYVYI